METRHEYELEKAIDQLSDVGVVQIHQDNWRRWYGVSRTGSRTKKSFVDHILLRLEKDGYEDGSFTLNIIVYDGVWTLVFTNETNLIQTLAEWAGNE